MVNYTFSLVDFEVLILIVVRISCFVSVAPFFGTRNVPNQVKIGFSVLVAIIIFASVDQSSLTYTGMFGYAIIVMREGITGLLMGLAANICNSIILFAGNIIDMDIGLSMAQEFDMMTNSQTTITGSLYNYFLMLMLVVTNMHHYLLRALVDSYQVIPVNAQVFDWTSLSNSMIRFMTDMFVIAFRIVLPVFACIMILNCILGIMAKVAPQMNMFAVGMQMKVLLGLVILFLTIILLPGIADMVFMEMRRMVRAMIEGMY